MYEISKQSNNRRTRKKLCYLWKVPFLPSSILHYAIYCLLCAFMCCTYMLVKGLTENNGKIGFKVICNKKKSMLALRK